MKKGVSLLLGFVIIAIYLVSAGIGDAFSQDISRPPTEFAPYGLPLGRNTPKTVDVTLYAHERTGTIDAGLDGAIGGGDDITYNVMTFGSSSDPETGRIPGPFIRVLEGDTINVTLNNSLGKGPGTLPVVGSLLEPKVITLYVMSSPPPMAPSGPASMVPVRSCA